jgi:hypothetical protein
MEEVSEPERIRKAHMGKTIASARTHGPISQKEAEFLLDEYLKEWQGQTDRNQQNFRNLFG